MRKSVASVGLGLALVSAASGTALAHSPAAGDIEAPHTYTNAEICNAGDPAPDGPSQSTDLGYPNPSSAYGSYAADCQSVQGTDTATLGATVHMLASITLDDVINDTANVVSSGVSGINPGDTITAFDFPTQTPNGGVNSDTMHVEVTTNSDWELSAEVSGDFTQTTSNGGEVKPVDTFSVVAENDSNATTTEVGGAFTALDTPVIVQTTIDDALQVSGPFHFRSGAAAATEAGDYLGEITLTVTAI